MAGWDKEEGPGVYFIDYLGSLQSMNFAVHGYAGYFLLSLLDKYYTEGLNVEVWGLATLLFVILYNTQTMVGNCWWLLLQEGKELLRKCVTELRTRFIVSTRYLAKVVSEKGIEIVHFEGEDVANTAA